LALVAAGVEPGADVERFSFWQPKPRASPDRTGTANHHLVLFIMTNLPFSGMSIRRDRERGIRRRSESGRRGGHRIREERTAPFRSPHTT